MKVSAIIPVYNGELWLSEALDSIRSQTRPVDELIVVDDASEDKSAEIATEFGAKVVRLEKNSGEGAARNAGLRCAIGDAIAWLDADDIWAPNHIEVLCSLLNQYPEATAAFAAVQRFGLRSELIKGHVPVGPPTNVFWAAFHDWVHTTIGSMTRRDALLEIGGFDTDQRYAVDYDLWLRLARDHLFVCTHEITSFWRWHEEQQSQRYGEQLQAVYHFRHRYLIEEERSGDPDVARELNKRLAFLFKRDIEQALASRDIQLATCLFKISGIVPGLSTANLARFRLFYYMTRMRALSNRVRSVLDRSLIF